MAQEMHTPIPTPIIACTALGSLVLNKIERSYDRIIFLSM